MDDWLLGFIMKLIVNQLFKSFDETGHFTVNML